jgi:hypothetical protein
MSSLTSQLLSWGCSEHTRKKWSYRKRYGRFYGIFLAANFTAPTVVYHCIRNKFDILQNIFDEMALSKE